MKTARVYLRTTPEDKEFLELLADKEHGGNLAALFDKIIDDLKGEHKDGKP